MKSKEYKSMEEPSKKLYNPKEIKFWDFINDKWLTKFFVFISLIQVNSFFVSFSGILFAFISVFIIFSIWDLSSVIKYNRYNALL